MKKEKKEKAVNSDAFQYLKSMLHPTVKVLDLEVVGKWLKASLSSGVYFSVRNTRLD